MEDDLAYNAYIETMRQAEYPMLKDAIYLDHAGTTLYSKRLMEHFSADMMSNLYGNPHSASQSSQRSTRQIDDARLQLLRFLNADPEHFDVVFVANATAGIKMVADAFQEQEQGFSYGYHRDSHTSLVGVRELARDHKCFESDKEVEGWLDGLASHGLADGQCGLFAYPAQSNMNGRRLPLRWAGRHRHAGVERTRRLFTMLDAAALLSTTALDLSDAGAAPDFVVMSLYKIFGFPDLGALVVRKDAGWVLQQRRYFGGGTVDMVVSLEEQWHAKKSTSLHDQLEDGTLPIHSIVALRSAIKTHQELYYSLDRISMHTAFLAKRLHDDLASMTHPNLEPVAQIYKDPSSSYGDSLTQGPIVAFNFRESTGMWVSNTEVEKVASIKNIDIRTGGLCNPGGIASSLGLAPWEMKQNFSAGQRCGTENDVMSGKPTGMIRASLGAMSTLGDVEAFLTFAREFFVETEAQPVAPGSPVVVAEEETRFYVESLTVYPIKSCAGWNIPIDIAWEVRPEGLAWDREWCLVHQGTGAALSQKHYPRMALIRPSLDFKAGVLRVQAFVDNEEITVPLSADPRCFASDKSIKAQQTTVCGDVITAKAYTSRTIADFLSRVIGVPCQLARFPAATDACPSTRHSKAHLQHPAASPPRSKRPILLSNESPILTISRSSLNRLNEDIKARAGGKAASPAAFRANIVLAESPCIPPGHERPYAEDGWSHVRIGAQYFEFLGGCRRCQMVCVDQCTGTRDEEPFVTLAKTRRFAGKVLFGVHTCHVQSGSSAQCASIAVGDAAKTFVRGARLEQTLVDAIG